jgi:hypothetical protein
MGALRKENNTLSLTFVTCQDLPGVYWYLMLYLPPYTISNRLQGAWLKSVSFEASRLCRSGIIVDPRLLI